MRTTEAASKGAQGALGFGGAPLRLAERKARNPALRAGKFALRAGRFFAFSSRSFRSPAPPRRPPRGLRSRRRIRS
jgi:hypothetical protein